MTVHINLQHYDSNMFTFYSNILKI